MTSFQSIGRHWPHRPKASTSASHLTVHNAVEKDQLKTGGPREGKGGAVRASSKASGKACTMYARASCTCAKAATVGGGNAGVAWAHRGHSMLLLTGVASPSPCTTNFMMPMAEHTTSMVLGCSVAAKTETPTNSTYQASTQRAHSRRVVVKANMAAIRLKEDVSVQKFHCKWISACAPNGHRHAS